jgi:hypothetical protein
MIEHTSSQLSKFTSVPTAIEVAATFLIHLCPLLAASTLLNWAKSVLKTISLKVGFFWLQIFSLGILHFPHPKQS